MCERKWYHNRYVDAINHSANKATRTCDGMAQHNYPLPHGGQKSDYQSKLHLHFQGVINHGGGFRIYRPFHKGKLNADANLQLHCLLVDLEAIYQR